MSRIADAQDLLRVVRRRSRLVIAVTAIIGVVATIVIAALPDVFIARSIVHVERRRLPRSFEQAGIVVPPLSEVIGPLRQEVLSRDVLREVIDDLQLYGGGSTAARAPRGLLERLRYVDPVERAREDIDIKILKKNEQEFVEITARARSAALAARTANRMADILSAKNRDLRLRLAEDVSRFLQAELDKARERLADEEARLQRFRGEHADSLPEAHERVFDRLRTLAFRAEDTQAKIDDTRQKVAATELEIEALRARARIAAGKPRGEGPAEPAEVTALNAELAALRRRDEDFALKYTSEHPERMAISQKIASIGERLSDAARAVAQAHAAGAEPEPKARPAPAAPSAPARLDARRVVEELVELRATPEAVEQAEKLLGAIAVLTLRLDGLRRDNEREIEETERLERQRAALAPTRLEYERLAKAQDEAQKVHADLSAERQVMQKFLDAERAMHGDQLRTIEAAEAPPVPAEPRRLLLEAIALAGALALGVGLAYALELRRLESRRGTLATSAEVEKDLSMGVLAVIPEVARPHEMTSYLARAEDAEEGREIFDDWNFDDWSGLFLTEQFNRARHFVKHNPRVAGARAILVTSALEGEGKTTVAIGLARAFAESLDDRALLVEADLRRPALARQLHMRPPKGLSDHLVDGLALEDAVRPTTVPRLSVLCAGERAVSGAANVVASEQMRLFVEEARRRDPGRMLILDSPPIGATLEPLSLALLVDGIILVVRADRTPREAVAQALRTLPAEKILGVILNGVPADREDPQLFGSYYVSGPARYVLAGQEMQTS